ncbi:MAG TPA: HAD-IB family phosphatase [Actinophytocola sp.]|uniref:HAD family hydrolase n=1 Tax=Actinophytocola sp. TaxID=1872138 RepID=UPI002DF9854D|nr:HAD-IB family phosphatase [Actinophytocola sp.]
MSAIRVVVLDVDETLTEGNSWSELTLGLGASLEDHLAIYRRVNAGELTVERAAAQVAELWRATGNATRTAMDAIFARMPFREGAAELVTWLGHNGFQAVLISGSMDVAVAGVARRLGVDTWYANAHLTFDAGGALTALHYEANQGAAKLRQLEDLCAARNLDIRMVTVVGDGENDTELFIATGRGILLAGDLPPRYNAWRVISRLDEIPAILSATG